MINRRLARHEAEKSVIQEVMLQRDETILFTVPGYYRAQLSRSGYFDTQYKVWVIPKHLVILRIVKSAVIVPFTR